MESTKQKAEREERERLERIEKELEEKRIREEIIATENILRVDQLIESGNIIRTYESTGTETEVSTFEHEVYIECRSIPDISKLNDVNSFYVDWVNQILRGQVKLEFVYQHTPIILQLIEEMQEFLQLPPSTSSIQNLLEMGLIYHDFCETQQKFLNQGSYNIMIDLRNLFDPELGVFENSLSTKEIVHSLWGNLYSRPEYRGHFFESLNFRFTLPDTLVMVKGIYRLLKTEYDHFSHSSNSYYPPHVQNFHRFSIQNWTKRKLLEQSHKSTDEIGEKLQTQSDKCAEDNNLKKYEIHVKLEEHAKSSPISAPPEGNIEKVQDASEFATAKDKSHSKPRPGSNTQEELNSNDKDKGSRGERERGEKNGEGQIPEVTLLVEDAEGDIKKLEVDVGQEKESVISIEKDETDGKSQSDRKSASSSKKSKKVKTKPVVVQEDRPKTEAELAKDRERSEKAKFLPHLVHPNELNLRNYVILAGVYNFKLFQIPPQPVPRGRNAWTLHQIEADESLKEIEFMADYVPPPADMSSIRKTPEEMEREAKRQEEELQKLVHLEIKVPKIALWFDPPTPVRWIPDHRLWSTEGFYDVRFSEYSLQLSFRTAKFGIIGLAHNRWSNLPYQSWEIRPNGLNCATFNLLAAMAVVEFTVKNEFVCVSSLQNVGNSDEVEKTMINQYMKPRQLIKALRAHGLDIFPEFDSYAYVDGVLIKESKTEDHMYQCMALASTAFNFHWSRWNLLAGRKKILYQMRERLGSSTPGNYQMVLNTPRSATLIDCTEVSPTYSEEPMENYQYHADLLQLLTNQVASNEAKEVMTNTSGQFVETLRNLLTSVRPLSFS